MSERIHKVLAAAGVASRRAVERLIAEGRVAVNGAPAAIGQKIGPRDRVTLDGRSLRLARDLEPPRALLYKKRVGELVTRADPEGRRTVFRKLPRLASGRWIAVGRLDLNSSGLLLLTNDGELARRLTHPRFGIEREYAVRVLGAPDAAALARLRRGVRLADGMARFEALDPLDDFADDEGERRSAPANRWYRAVLREGRHREVRRLFESQGLTVSRLIRVRYGPIELGRGIKSGSYRELTADELAALYAAVDLPVPKARPLKPRLSGPSR
jgi:23S rRNA pseudouridine2605 synthase